jgi:hypothetical protein
MLTESPLFFIHIPLLHSSFLVVRETLFIEEFKNDTENSSFQGEIQVIS